MRAEIVLLFRKRYFLFLLLSSVRLLAAQEAMPTDSLHAATGVGAYRLTYRKLIVPAVLIGYGFAGLHMDALRELNTSTRDEINEHRPDHIKLDNYTQYAPALLVYGFNAMGIKGQHNFKDRTLIYATSQLLVASMVVPLKYVVHEQRPDGSNYLSFPSGHTATAFSSAHFMFREYRESNFWLSISGYPFAAFTGIYRTINDRHWVGDVVAGAGFGILSTELAYWLYPKFQNLFHTDKTKLTSTVFMPYYQRNKVGLSMVKYF